MTDARITPGQVRAARQLLGWWQSDLAKMVRVSEKSVRAFESGELSGTSLDLDLVREVLESAGVEFIAESGEVRLKADALAIEHQARKKLSVSDRWSRAIFKARQIREAEKAQPGIVQRTRMFADG